VNNKLSMIDIHESEDFWIGLVEESIELDWREAYVPRDRLPVNVAVALAERLNMELDIDVSEYVFYQAGEPRLVVGESRVLH
jgi:hypothetical protein